MKKADHIIYKNFLKTFSEDKIKDINDYYKVVKLHRKGLSRKEIEKRVDTTIDKIYSWTERKTKPPHVKLIESARKRKYFDNLLNNYSEWLSYVIGYNLGDGHISRDLCHTWFYGVDIDLKKIRRHLIKFGVTPTIYTYKINNGKMAVCDATFSRLLYSLGAVVGDKTKSTYTVPDWIFKSKKRSILKKRFLQGLCDSELSKISRLDDRRFAFQSLKFYMIKEEKYVKNGISYLSQLRKIFSEFDITTTDVKEDRTYIRGRDGSRMVQLYFVVHSNYINLFSFLSNIDFLYNSKRVIDDVLFQKIKCCAELEINKIVNYEEALKLRERGLSAYKIAKILDFPIDYIRSWIYGKHKPRSICKKNFSSS